MDDKNPKYPQEEKLEKDIKSEKIKLDSVILKDSFYKRLPGFPKVAPPKYVCPVQNCNYSFYPPNAGALIPKCPTHNCELILKN